MLGDGYARIDSVHKCIVAAHRQQVEDDRREEPRGDRETCRQLPCHDDQASLGQATVGTFVIAFAQAGNAAGLLDDDSSSAAGPKSFRPTLRSIDSGQQVPQCSCKSETF